MNEPKNTWEFTTPNRQTWKIDLYDSHRVDPTAAYEEGEDHKIWYYKIFLKDYEGNKLIHWSTEITGLYDIQPNLCEIVKDYLSVVNSIFIDFITDQALKNKIL